MPRSCTCLIRPTPLAPDTATIAQNVIEASKPVTEQPRPDELVDYAAPSGAQEEYTPAEVELAQKPLAMGNMDVPAEEPALAVTVKALATVIDEGLVEPAVEVQRGALSV